MQDRPNYQYNDYNSLKDPNQQGQNSTKQGKKSNHNKYYKQGTNKNNNFDDMNINNTDHNPNYRHPRYKNQTYQDTGNRNNGPNFKKKKGKKRDNNNEFQYQGNNAIEINQPMKDDYIEQNNSMNLGGNGHVNMYGGKSYKKNQSNIYTNNNMSMNNNVINNNMNNINMNTSLGSMNSNTNSTGTSNISNLNITPQSNNQISPLSYNSNSPLNTKIPQQNVQNNMKPSIYINPKLSIDSLRKNENEKDMNLKGEKMGENLSEDNLNIQQGNKIGNNAIGILGNNLNNINNNLNQIDLTKNPNDFINQQEYMNQKFIPQQNNFYIPSYGINGIANIGNTIENMGNLNNINTMNNMNNLNQGSYPNIRNPYNQSPISHMGPSVPNINNMNNQMNNLSFNNFQRQFYDNNNNNNKIYPNQIQQNFNYSTPQDDMMTHKKMKKNNQNNSPFDQNNHSNPQMNLGMANLNYNGPNNTFKSNNNNQIKMNKLSQSSKPPKNTNPFINNDNMNLIGNQNQNQNISQILNLNYGQMNNRNIYMQQGIPVIRNPHMNQGYINNNHINIGNNQIKTEFQNANYNPNMINNKQKYPKYNQNSYQNQKHNNMNNNQMYQKNKNNSDMNNNLNMTNNKNYGYKPGTDHGNFIGSNKSMDQPKQSFLCLNIKFTDKTSKNILINKWDESQSVLDELLREGKIKTEREKKMILEKINKIYELVGRKKIYDMGIKAYTYKNLCEIHHKLNYQNVNQERKMLKNRFQVMKKNKSFEKYENILDDDKKLKLENVRNVGSLNITF